MVAIPLISGITATESADFNVAYPTNLEPIPTDTGLSKGYLRSASGAVTLAEGPGIDRGGILFNGLVHRVMETKLVSVNGSTVTELGDVGAGGPVGLAYGFGRLAIQSGTSLYYWDGATLVQVTDPDLGPCLDVEWFNGQYFSTDGTSIVATQINDPTAVDPLKYGSSESDPDRITGLIRIRDEMAVPNLNTIDFFTYVGGSGFPLQLNTGATIPIGCVGPRAKCLAFQSFAFVGGGRNQANAVWVAASGTAQKLSTRAVDDLIAQEPNPGGIELEMRVSRDEERLYVHLSAMTLVFLKNASQQAGQSVWYIAKSGRAMNKPYRPRHAVLNGNSWMVGDTETGNLGTLSDATSLHFGEAVGWQFQSTLLYNAAKGGIVHSLELVGLPGRATVGKVPTAFLSFTMDGETYSQERPNRLGVSGRRDMRCQWSPHRRFARYMGLKFRGDSDGLAGFATLEASIEPLTA